MPAVERVHFVNNCESVFYDKEKVEWKCWKGYFQVGKIYWAKYDSISFPFDIIWNETKLLTMNHYVSTPAPLEWSLPKRPFGASSSFVALRGNMTCTVFGWETLPRCQRRQFSYS